ncbi:hypothetical protein L484_024123 [Morus notabilis]|uniref:Uncharacterized protein n=1 Tax=Morus notabilis TaxID=981085 RepID=W9RM74_9ROSA|nr:hypothetical protein L484_024123 [Morus notabilis]
MSLKPNTPLFFSLLKASTGTPNLRRPSPSRPSPPPLLTSAGPHHRGPRHSTLTVVAPQRRESPLLQPSLD